VCVAEHEPEVAEMIRRYLSRAGLNCWLTASPAEVVVTLRAREALVYVLDLTMPGLDISLVRRTLGSGQAARAVFCVDGRGVRPRGLGAGPGERRWLTRPFSPRALAEMVCELAACPAQADDLVPAGLNASSRTATVSGREISLTRSEFVLLSALAEAAGRVLTRDQLLQRLAAERGKVPRQRAIDVYITQLRAKLGDGAIRTVRGTGYTLDHSA
jgi:DNA-binding response OmpR family regulator